MKIAFDKKVKSLTALYAISVIVFILLFAIIPFKKIATSYIVFAFFLISAIFSFCTCLYAFKTNEKNIKSKVYGFPIFRVGALYFIIQTVVFVLICIVAAFVYIPYWVGLLLSIILLALALIGVIATDNTRDIIEELEENTEKSTKNVSMFNIDMAGIIDSCNDADIKQRLEKLGEKFKYSDPVSSNATEEIETNIKAEIETLKDLLTRASLDEINKEIQKIDNMLAERNRICKANKAGY